MAYSSSMLITLSLIVYQSETSLVTTSVLSKYLHNNRPTLQQKDAVPLPTKETSDLRIYQGNQLEKLANFQEYTKLRPVRSLEISDIGCDVTSFICNQTATTLNTTPSQQWKKFCFLEIGVARACSEICEPRKTDFDKGHCNFRCPGEWNSQRCINYWNSIFWKNLASEKEILFPCMIIFVAQ